MRICCLLGRGLGDPGVLWDYSDRVELHEGWALLDASGWGDWWQAAQLARELLSLPAVAAGGLRAGLAPTRLAARLAARLAMPGGLFALPPQPAAQMVAAAPIWELELPRPTLRQLLALGVRRIGDLLAWGDRLPVPGVGRALREVHDAHVRPTPRRRQVVRRWEFDPPADSWPQVRRVVEHLAAGLPEGELRAELHTAGAVVPLPVPPAHPPKLDSPVRAVHLTWRELPPTALQLGLLGGDRGDLPDALRRLGAMEGVEVGEVVAGDPLRGVPPEWRPL